MGIMTNGVKQWIFQRTANAVFVAFGICLICVFMAENGLSYNSLTQLMSSVGFKLYLLITLLFAAVNGVLAAWQIDGDYAKKFGIPAMLITILSILVGIFYLIYGFKLLF